MKTSKFARAFTLVTAGLCALALVSGPAIAGDAISPLHHRQKIAPAGNALAFDKILLRHLDPLRCNHVYRADLHPRDSVCIERYVLEA